MTTELSQSRIVASKHAKLLSSYWEGALSLRISLQKVVDVSNKFPSDTNIKNIDNEKYLQSIMSNLHALLSRDNKKLEKVNWNDISSLTEKLKFGWKDTVNKWHSRLQYGTENSSKMKTFKKTFWEQVKESLSLKMLLTRFIL